MGYASSYFRELWTSLVDIELMFWKNKMHVLIFSFLEKCDLRKDEIEWGSPTCMTISYSTGNMNTTDSDKCIAKHKCKSSVAVKSQEATVS